MDDFRREIIIAFMSKAKENNNLRDGLGKVPQVSEVVSDSLGLIQCFIAFESFTNGEFGKTTAKDNRIEFCSTYNDEIETAYSSVSGEIDRIYNELQKEPLKDVSGRNPNDLDFPDKKNFERLFEVMYRVRSNIIHGGKEMKLPRNVLLINCSFKIFYGIFSYILINKESISFP